MHITKEEYQSDKNIKEVCQENLSSQWAVAWESVEYKKSGLRAVFAEVGKWDREGNLFEADAIIIIDVKEKESYSTLIFLLFLSSSRKLFKLTGE